MRRARRWIFPTAVAAASLALVVLISTAFRTVDQAEAQRSRSRQILTVLAECTTPPAERTPPVTKPNANDCFARAQQRTAVAVAQVAAQGGCLSFEAVGYRPPGYSPEEASGLAALCRRILGGSGLDFLRTITPK